MSSVLSAWFRSQARKPHSEAKEGKKVISISAHEFKRIGKMLKELEYVKVPVEVGTEAIHAK